MPAVALARNATYTREPESPSAVQTLCPTIFPPSRVNPPTSSSQKKPHSDVPVSVRVAPCMTMRVLAGGLKAVPLMPALAKL